MATSLPPTFKSSVLPYLLVMPQLVITLIFFLWQAAQSLWSSLQTSDPFGFSSRFSGWLNFQNFLMILITLSPLKRRLFSVDS